MKNCGKRFHSEVGKFRFLNELIKVVSPKVMIPVFYAVMPENYILWGFVNQWKQPFVAVEILREELNETTEQGGSCQCIYHVVFDVKA